MGLLVNGKWHTDWYDTKSTGGKFKRKASSFRNWITLDGSAGMTGKAGVKAEPNRYHLYQVGGIAQTVDINYIKAAAMRRLIPRVLSLKGLN